LPFPIFPPPAFTSDLDYTTGIQLIGQITIRFGPNPEDVLKKLKVDRIKITPRKLYPTSFARMLAKIAYSYAFAEGVLNALDGESVVLPSILGKRDEIGLWVGTVEEPIKSTQGLLHRLALFEDREQGFLMAEVQLFSDSQTPSYHVILGKLR